MMTLVGYNRDGDNAFYAEYEPGDIPDTFKVVPGASEEIISDLVDAGVRREEELAKWGSRYDFSSIYDP